MKTLIVAVLLFSGLAAGCAQGYYSGSPSPPASYYIGVGGAVPPSFYNDNPSLQDWYTAPYWNPEVPGG